MFVGFFTSKVGSRHEGGNRGARLAARWSLAALTLAAVGCGDSGGSDVPATGTTSGTPVLPATGGPSVTMEVVPTTTGGAPATTGFVPVTTAGAAGTTNTAGGGATTNTTGFVAVTTAGGGLSGGASGTTAGFGGGGALGGDAGLGGLAGGGAIGGAFGGGGEIADIPPYEGEGPNPALLPTVNGACPSMRDGEVEVLGARVKLWVGGKPGPVYFYFHGTGTTAGEVDSALPGATRGVAQNGGFVASWVGSNNQGTVTGNLVWYTGDFDAADQLIACGIEEGIVDVNRIHAAGYSAGGLQTGTMAYQRSHYLASVIVYSGGNIVPGGLSDPSHAPSMLGAHGAAGSDWLALDFGTMTPDLVKEFSAAGAPSAIDCDDGGGHVVIGGLGGRFGVDGAAMKFLTDHPFGVDSYGGSLPSDYPSHCQMF